MGDVYAHVRHDHLPVERAQNKKAQPPISESHALFNMVEAAGVEPQTEVVSETTEPSQNSAKTKQISALEQSASRGGKQKNALSIQNQDISEHPKCATYVQQNLPDDLAVVVSAWDSLPEKVKDRIAALVRQG